ncbi:MAG: hypothetical protein DRP30_03230 [Thermotoga sp.]|nr:MAG: hypothetical protein DRP30_03230 [Thermotoga sp.]
MKKVISFILIVLLIVSVFSKVIKSDDVGKWATKGVGKDSFTFIIFGDSRPTSPSRPMPDDLLSRILQEISLIHPDFVIHTGDMIVGYTDTLDQAKEEFSSFLKLLYTYAPDVDFLFVPGNHELKPSEEIANLYRKLFGEKLYYDFEYGNSHFIMLNMNFPSSLLQKGQKYGFYNANDGLHTLGMVDWTKEVLKKPSTHKFVVGHVPAFSALTPDFAFKHTKSFDNKENRDTFVELLTSNDVDAYFAGHEHLTYVRKIGDTLFFTLGGGGAPIYTPVSGGYGVNAGGKPYDKVTFDPRFDHGGHAKGYHFDLHVPAGALGIFAYMIVTVNGDDVSYELVVPFSYSVKYVKGNDGVNDEAIAIVANRTAYPRTLRGLTFIMPYSENGYEVSATYVSWGRQVKPAKIQPKIVEVKKIDDYRAKVRVEVTVPAGDSLDVVLKAK